MGETMRKGSPPITILFSWAEPETLIKRPDGRKKYIWFLEIEIEQNDVWRFPIRQNKYSYNWMLNFSWNTLWSLSLAITLSNKKKQKGFIIIFTIVTAYKCTILLNTTLNYKVNSKLHFSKKVIEEMVLLLIIQFHKINQ